MVSKTKELSSNKKRILSYKEVHRKLENRRKLFDIQTSLIQNRFGCDIKWSLFVAACNCHIYEDTVNPFPFRYFKRNPDKNIVDLLQIIEDTPPFALLVQQGKKVKSSVIDLLHWLLVEISEPAIKLVKLEKPSQIDAVLDCVSCQSTFPKPHSIFEVQYAKNNKEEKHWKSIAKQTQSKHLCYGNKLEYFHTILHKGLKLIGGSFGKTKNTGIFLSNNICDAINESTTGFGWGGSELGSSLSCVAICELADHDQFMCCVKYPERENGAPTIKHYNVIKPELARIRYLLVYGDQTNYMDSRKPKGLLHWIRNNKLLVGFISYGLLIFGGAYVTMPV